MPEQRRADNRQFLLGQETIARLAFPRIPLKVGLSSGAIVLFVVVIAGLKSRLYLVNGSSMMPRLVPGDIVLCGRSDGITHGDIVVFREPGTGSVGVKRVVGLGHDKITYNQKTLLVNGKIANKRLLEELPIDHPSDLRLEQSISGTRFEIYELFGPPLIDTTIALTDEYFLLGDNRDHSVDSRTFGAIPSSAIQCEAVAIVGTERDGHFKFWRMTTLP